MARVSVYLYEGSSPEQRFRCGKKIIEFVGRAFDEPLEYQHVSFREYKKTDLLRGKRAEG